MYKRFCRPIYKNKRTSLSQNYFFLHTETGQQITGGSLNAIMRKSLDHLLGLKNRNVTVNALRHLFATYVELHSVPLIQSAPLVYEIADHLQILTQVLFPPVHFERVSA